MSIIVKFLNLIKNNKGSGPIVATVILFPLLAGLIFGTIMYAQMTNVQNITEEAARAGARYYAANYGLMNEEALKDQSRLEAAKVVAGSKNITPVKDIDITFPPNIRVGILTKDHGKFYIDTQWCRPANNTVHEEMKKLVGKKVFAQGEMVESSIFNVNEATTNPPEVQTVSQEAREIPLGTWGSQTVGQTDHSSPSNAKALVPYGSGPWYTDWPTNWPDSGAWWIWGGQYPADKCGLNGQILTLKSPVFWTVGYGKYRLYANADDWFNVRVDVTDVLQGEGPGTKTWDWDPGPSRPVQFNVLTWNGYGPAGFISTFKQIGWHWPVSYTPSYSLWGWFHYPGWTVPYAQWVNIKAKNQYGNSVHIYVDTYDTPNVANGNGECNFYAYPGITYSVCLYSETLNNDLVVNLNGEVMLHSDSNWSYLNADGVQYQPVTLPEKVTPDTEFNVNLTVKNDAGTIWFASKPDWWGYGPNNWQTNFSYHWYNEGGNLVTLDGLRTNLPYDVNGWGSVNLNLKIKSPTTPGKYKLVIDGVQEAVAWFGPVQGVNRPTVEAWIDVVGDLLSYNVLYDPVDVPKYMEAGKTYNLTVKAKNTGSISWTPGNFGLSYHWYKEPGHVIKIWDGTRDYVDYTVPPGGTYTFSLSVTAPADPGNYTLEIDMVHENVAWFKEKDCKTLNAAVKVPSGEILKGNLIWCGDCYMVNSYIIEYNDPLVESKLAMLSGKDVILWGKYKDRVSYFRVDNIEEYKAGDWTAESTFDDNLDIETKKVTENGKDYAFCKVTYHYPIPVRTLMRLVHLGDEPPSREIVGSAYFKLGEQ